ncbi:MAG: aconitase X [Alphaproteobacteria bacterium]
MTERTKVLQLVEGSGSGPVLTCDTGISFWGGIDPLSGRVIDVHHPNHGDCVADQVLVMPTSRGSCSGSGVLLELALNGKAPAALLFCEDEETLTLGALVAGRIFDKTVPVCRVSKAIFERVQRAQTITIDDGLLHVDTDPFPVERLTPETLELTATDRRLLAGEEGAAKRIAMEVLCQMAVSQGAKRLHDVTRGHIDGCILAHDANLIFAEKLAEMGAAVRIPTTINAISVDRENWPGQGWSEDFGGKASRLADAYVRMGAQPTFTCAPYLLDEPPQTGEAIGWSESNAVIFANSVLGARTVKHPDYLDLFIAMTGRAPLAGVYEDAGRRPRRRVDVSLPEAAGADESLWALLGWLIGRAAPDRIPLVTGLEDAELTQDDLKSICAAFGTTSGAPLLHLAGHTPEAHLPLTEDADSVTIGAPEFSLAWRELNQATEPVDLVAIGSPHASLEECHRLAELIGEKTCGSVPMIVTVGRNVRDKAQADGTLEHLKKAGVRVIPDICWCSITEPVFPPAAKSILTNSGKYAHYAFGLSGRHVRLGGLADCVDAAVNGQEPRVPEWLKQV